MKTLKLTPEFASVRIRCTKCGKYIVVNNIDDVMNMANGTAFKCNYCHTTLAEVIDA